MSQFTWTDRSVRQALGLSVDLADPSLEYASVSTDSRSVGEGTLFVALVGESFDGHDFVVDALAKGASGAVVSRPVETSPSAPLYPVDDTLVALGSLATFRRNALDVPVVAITGSSGKTTTKDLTRAALGMTRVVHATSGNLNNRIGVPLTLLSTPTEVEVVLVEMGSNEPGEISMLSAIARPDIAVVTTVGESHLDRLGSLAGVLDEKLDLFRSMTEGGRCVVGDKPPALVDAARAICSDLRIAGWSERADPNLRPEQFELDVFGAPRFKWRGHPVTLALPGRHSVVNALISLAISELVGVSPRDAVRGLASAEVSPLRCEMRQIGNVRVVADCYNANPQSLRAALEVLIDQPGNSRTVAVLGTMLELGNEAARLHEETLEYALGLNIDLVVATGGFAEAAEALEVDEPEVLRSQDWRKAYPALRDWLEGDEVLLLKASRGIALEAMLPLLDSDFGSKGASIVVGEA
jgi:UDP-N-acetylmuramoyl-tripeptide--D-alanyl-D-alanine ligase